MASIMLVDFSCAPAGYGHPILFRTIWRPGTAGGSVADATDALARVRAQLATVAAAFSTSAVWTPNLTVKVLEDSTGNITSVLTGANPGTVGGTSGGDLISPANAYLINAHTNLVVGRRFLQGRHFVGGGTEGGNGSNGAPNNANAVATALQGLLTGGATSSFPVVWHRPSRSTLTGGTSGPITAYVANNVKWGVQKRRRP